MEKKLEPDVGLFYVTFRVEESTPLLHIWGLGHAEHKSPLFLWHDPGVAPGRPSM